MPSFVSQIPGLIELRQHGRLFRDFITNSDPTVLLGFGGKI